MTGHSREHLLRLLIAGAAPLDKVVQELGALEWDSDRELVVLTRADVVAMLDRYVQGEVERAAVEAWADAIEGREDIGYEPEAEATLAEFVFELANPELTAKLTPEVASNWMRKMQRD